MMRTKKAIANQFKANEAIVDSLNAPIIKKGRYKVLNASGEYETIHLETNATQVIENTNKKFVSDSEKETWNNKMDKGGSLSQDFSARNLNVSNAILPTKDGIDIGSAENRFRGIYVDEAYLSTNTLYIGDTPILGTNDDTVIIKADPNQSITMQTRATGMTKVISEAGVQLSTSGMNANVLLQATGSNSQVNIGSTGSTNINAANVNITGASTFKSSIRAEKDLTIDGNLSVTGDNATLSTSNLIIKDNLVEINNGESGNGVTAGKAGIRINRGDADAFNVVFDETDDSLKVGPESALKTVALQDWVVANTVKPNHTHNYLPLSGGNLTGNLTINSNAVYHTGNKPTASDIGAAPSSHNHNSGNITALTGYVKPSSTSAIATTDTLNAALGKLEKGLEGKKEASWTPTWNEVSGKPSTFTPAVHNHASSDINKMTGYTKGTSTSAIDAADTLNAAISKLEVALDSKSNTHNHPYRPNTWVPAWSDITNKPTFATVATSGSYNDLTNKPTIISINDSSTTATTQTWSAKKINDSLAGKAASSHTHTADQITGLGSAATLNAGISANQVLKLDSSGKVPVSTLPSIAVNETFIAADQAAALKLTIEVGDIVIVTADGKTYICVDKSKTVFDEKFKPLGSATDGYTKAEVEALLGNKVDKVSGKQLSTNDFTSEYKAKLDGIATGANNYVHPNDANTRHVTDAEKSTWNSKAAGNHNHDSVYFKSTGGIISGETVFNNYLSLNALPEYGTGKAQLWFNGNTKALVLQPSTTDIVIGSNYVYHAGRKPTPAEIGAAASSHGTHVPAPQTADARKFLRNDNTWQSLPAATTGATGIVQLNDAVNSTSTTQAATANAVKKAYDLANGKAASNHNHDSVYQKLVDSWKIEPKKLAEKTDLNTLYTSGVYASDLDGNSTTIVNRPPGSQGFSLVVYEIYGTGVAGRQIQVAYMRNNQGIYMRDKSENAAWTAWVKVYTSVTKPTAAEVGALATTGKAADSSKLNGVAESTASTANTIAKRDAAGDVNCRLVRSEYANQSNISGAIAFRINNSSDNYVRFCSDTNAIRSFLNTYSKSETYTKSEMDNRYRQKTDTVFTESISIITPSA